MLRIVMAAFCITLLVVIFLSHALAAVGRSEADRRYLELDRIIKLQQRQFDNLLVQVSDLSFQVSEKDSELTSLKERMDSLETKCPSNNEMSDINGESVLESKEDERIFTVSRRTRRQESANVAFHVYLSGNRCYSNHETFVFDVEETDTGNDYNMGDGIFDVPVTGTYVFTLTVGSAVHRYLLAQIMVNGQVKGQAFADSQDISDIHTGSTTVVIHANAGDHVFVRTEYSSNNCDVISHNAYTRTSFSGWLLF